MGKIGKDTFLFLTPKTVGEREYFAQCGPCRMYVPPEAVEALGGGRCIIHGSKVEIDADDSCGFMCGWPTPDGSPNPQVVHDHAAELLKIIPGSVTPTESGLVDRRVQCHRCRFAEAGATKCGLYAELNAKMPDKCAIDTKITPNSCCNAQEPRLAAVKAVAESPDADDAPRFGRMRR